MISGIPESCKERLELTGLSSHLFWSLQDTDLGIREEFCLAFGFRVWGCIMAILEGIYKGFKRDL